MKIKLGVKRCLNIGSSRLIKKRGRISVLGTVKKEGIQA
jgi:hypothetical protein